MPGLALADLAGTGAIIYQNAQQNKQLGEITRQTQELSAQDEMLIDIINRLERIEKRLNHE